MSGNIKAIVVAPNSMDFFINNFANVLLLPNGGLPIIRILLPSNL